MPDYSVTTWTEPSPDRTLNEDRVLVCGDVIGVFDGVSAPVGLDSGCVHTVSWYVSHLVSRLTEAIRQDPSNTLTWYLASALEAVRSDHQGQCDLSNPATPASTVCMVKLDPHSPSPRLDYLLLSDSTLLIDNGVSVSALTDERFEQAMNTIRTPSPTMSSPDYPAWVHGHMQRKHLLTNRPGGYWTAAATIDAAHHAVTGSLPLASLRRAALLTDGASRTVEVFGLHTWPDLLDILEAQGPQDLVRQIRAAEKAGGPEYDPPHKQHDDATVAFLKC